MRKRYHTNQSKYQFSLNSSSSNRALRSSVKSARRDVSSKLAVAAKQSVKLAEKSDESIIPLAEWDKEDEYEMKLEDEISENELKGFAFSCIESLANLAQSGKQSIGVLLADLVAEKLTSFVELANESKEVRAQFKEYVAWSKQFISSVQPLLVSATGPAQELGQLNTQVIQCAERSMCQKYRSETLAKRVDFLVGSVPVYVVQVGVEMDLPEAVMKKVAIALNRALFAASE